MIPANLTPEQEAAIIKLRVAGIHLSKEIASQTGCKHADVQRVLQRYADWKRGERKTPYSHDVQPHHDDEKTYLPTPEQIEEACAELRVKKQAAGFAPECEQSGIRVYSERRIHDSTVFKLR